VRGWLEESGFGVARLKGLECSSPRAIAEVPQDTIRAELEALDGDDVDALVQVGTNLAGAAIAAELERRIGKPVIQINTVSAWAALRRSGIIDKVEGRGLILERH
jgi:maleate isomerase